MIALIIENDTAVPDTVAAFVRDNPSLFSEVYAETICCHKSAASLMASIQKADSLIIKSDFGPHDKSKVEAIAEALVKGPLSGKKYKVFVFNLVDHCNKWNIPVGPTVDGFGSSRRFIRNLQTLAARKQLFNVRSAISSPMLADPYFHEPFSEKVVTVKRHPFTAAALCYCPLTDSFFEVAEPIIKPKNASKNVQPISIKICVRPRL